MKNSVNKKNIVIIGNTNSGKSTLFNTLINQEKALTSSIPGTTTDPVEKIIELINYGPVRLIDTPGLNDYSYLGEKRVAKALSKIKQSDLVLYVISSKEIINTNIDTYVSNLKKEPYLANRKVLFIVSKSDLYPTYDYKNYFAINNQDFLWLNKLYELIAANLEQISETNLLAGLVTSGQRVLLVTPIDNEAPQGRLILPQVQTLRALIDLGASGTVTTLENVKDNIAKDHYDLVITDSKVFKEVANLIPPTMRLTSFSILFARQKGDIKAFISGAQNIKGLMEGDYILIAEACTHSSSHEDIARVMIPKLITQKYNKKFIFEYSNGELPENIIKYSLIIQCGGCMKNRLYMQNIIRQANEYGIGITNFGILISYLAGELERATY